MSEKLTNEQVDAAMSGMSGKMGEAKSQQGIARDLLALVLAATSAHSGDGQIKLEGKDLSGFSFRKMALTRVHFIGCDLSFVSFRGCDLRRAAFLGCILTGASFRDADMGEVCIDRSTCHFSCDLIGAKFESEPREKRIAAPLIV